MDLRLVAAIYEQLRRISGPGPGQPALWLTACAEPSAEVTANAALVGRIGEGLGWAGPWLVTVRLLCQLGALGEAMSLPGPGVTASQQSVFAAPFLGAVAFA